MGKPVCNVMIDLETLDVSSNAAVIQAGIVYCDPEGNIVKKQMSCSPVKYRDYMEEFSCSQATINFHNKECPENFKHCLQSSSSLGELARFIRDTVEEAKAGGQYAIRLWSCGTDFDLPIVTNLLKFCGLKPCWSYSNVRDYRTLREIYKEQVPKGYKNNHNALDDAENQYLHLMQILDYIANCNNLKDAASRIYKKDLHTNNGDIRSDAEYRNGWNSCIDHILGT